MKKLFETYPKTKGISIFIVIAAILSVVLYFGLKDGGFMRGEKVNQRDGNTVPQSVEGRPGINRDDDIRDPAVANKIGDTTDTGPVINEEVDNENVTVDNRDPTKNSQTIVTSPILNPSDFGAPSSSEEPASSEPPTTLAPASTEPPNPFNTGMPRTEKLNVQHFDNIDMVGRKTVNFDWPTDKKLVEISFNFETKQPLNKIGKYGIMENMRHDNSSTPRSGFGIFINNLVPELYINTINNAGKRESNVLRLPNVKILPDREYFFDVKLYYQTERPYEQYAVFSVESNDQLYQDRKVVSVDGQNSFLLPINKNFVHGNTIMFGDDSCCNGRTLPSFEITDFNIDLSNNLKIPHDVEQGPPMEIPFTVYTKPIWITGTNNFPYRSLDEGKTWQRVESPRPPPPSYSPNQIRNELPIFDVTIATDGTVMASRVPIETEPTYMDLNGTKILMKPASKLNQVFRLNTRDLKPELSTGIWSEIGQNSLVTPESYNKVWNTVFGTDILTGKTNITTRGYPKTMTIFGNTSTSIWPDPSSGQEKKSLKHVSVKNYPSGKRVIGIGTDDKVYENKDNKTWTKLGDNSMKMVVPAPDKTLHGIGMDNRIYKSQDNGKSWQAYPDGQHIVKFINNGIHTTLGYSLNRSSWIDISSSGKLWSLSYDVPKHHTVNQNGNIPIYWDGTKWVVPNLNARGLTISVM